MCAGSPQPAPGPLFRSADSAAVTSVHVPPLQAHFRIGKHGASLRPHPEPPAPVRRSRPDARGRGPPDSPGSSPGRRRMPVVRRLPAGRKRSGSRQSRATREPRLVNPVALRVRPRAKRADEPGPHVAPRFEFPPSPHSTPPPPLCPQAATRGAIVGPRPGGPGSSERNSTRRRGRRVARDGRSLATPQDIAGSSKWARDKQPCGCGSDPADQVIRWRDLWRSRPGGPGRPAALDPSTWSAGRPVGGLRPRWTSRGRPRCARQQPSGPVPTRRAGSFDEARPSVGSPVLVGLPTRTEEPTRAAGSFETRRSGSLWNRLAPTSVCGTFGPSGRSA